ncbi:DUF4351 domain-containing protein [Nostoc sp. PCC 7107]|uniref:DUF4351 domain-containing protein n=1 Tax=Nostoc sp. PCC 7107 TaxID=317936 RepID=UPI00029F0477|nr:DUF4351 domain-containing protein [Nostoc sp. PCC 7107]AFY43116.1 hypothetical protein Nos7107_2512 [Nostoc sp. PCC 7107]
MLLLSIFTICRILFSNWYKRFGELSTEMRSHISSLPLLILEDLSEALLDFGNLADVQVWLEAVGN